MSQPEAAWIVRAQWSNSGDTFHGPWVYADDAETWARVALGDERGCTGWDVAILQPTRDRFRAVDA